MTPATEAASRRPAFRCAHLAPLVWRVADDGVADALIGDRRRAVRAALVLDKVAALPAPGLARAARDGAAAIRRALGIVRDAPPAQSPAPAAILALRPARRHEARPA